MHPARATGEPQKSRYTAKGYLAGQFDDVFSRYLPKNAFSRVTAAQRLENKGLAETPSVTKTAAVTDRKSEKPYENRDCYGVTDKDAGKEGGGEGYPLPGLTPRFFRHLI
jgi:hypothetical protein